MKQIYYIGMIAGMLSLASCSNDEYLEPAEESLNSLTSLHADIEGNGTTRAILAEDPNSLDRTVEWRETDKIKVFSDVDANPTNFYIDSFDGPKATFVGEDKVEGNEFYAVYAPLGFTIDEEKSHIISFDLNYSVANYYQNEYIIPMVAKSTGDSFTFKQVAGLIHVQVAGVPLVSRVEIRTNNNEGISGDGYIDLTESEPVFRLYDNMEHPTYSSIYNSLTGYEVLPESRVVDIYFAVAPTTFEKGFSFYVTGYDEQWNRISFSKTISSAITIERASVYHTPIVYGDKEVEKQQQEQP